MSIATPRTVSHEPRALDPVRILAFSGAIASNLIAAGLLLMPLQPPTPEPQRDAPTVWILPATPPVPPPVALPRSPIPAPTPAVAPRLAPTPPVPAPVVVEQGALPPALPAVDAAVVSVPAGPGTTGPAPMQLDYAVAPPPPYPRESVRNGDEGVVVLQVLVGVDGHPLEVVVVEGSGHRALDRAARRHVLEAWRFRPAIRDGHPVQAIGLVPIEFSLD